MITDLPMIILNSYFLIICYLQYRKQQKITETTATIIDNILTNYENVIKSSILVTDITDYMPTVLTTRNNLTNTLVVLRKLQKNSLWW